MQKADSEKFIHGRELCRRFFFECVQPLIQQKFPYLQYSAGLLGYGSDVLGYDDMTSTDHMWGPRNYIFIRDECADIAKRIFDELNAHIPDKFLGFDTRVFRLNSTGGFDTENARQPLIFITTIEKFLRNELGTADLNAISDIQWLAMSEHKLLSLASADVYLDELGITAQLDAIKYYPEHIRRYFIACDWAVISEEQAFVKRTGARGDALGSQIICARIVQRLIHLCFLYCKRYAPYSKWLGTAFAGLPVNKKIGESFAVALSAPDTATRERAIATAQQNVLILHNESGLTKSLPTGIDRYYERDIMVIHADEVAAAIMDGCAAGLRNLPPVGSLSAVGNLTALCEHGKYFGGICALYEGCKK